ncbi:multifunctional methyltransferase subunit TRM112-like protein [Amia ocellicauda]|uniref:multifunctional methyltransferase subunit TRM112-like protein n=1 Tax=Amia ocellicauda TaxID=2972642 RepID=UPI0034647A38|nr:TR112 protein [Amia calva]
MKLLTHNMLTSHVKGVTNGYPLIIKASEVKQVEVEFSAQFVCRMLPKLDWSALVQAAQSVGVTGLPEALAAEYEQDEEFLRVAHHALLEVEVVEGCLQCPESGRQFPVSRGIPNMLLTEEEG